MDLAFAGATEQAQLLATGRLTAPALLELYLERIARLDPQLRAYRVVLAETARSEAAAAQDRIDAGERLPLLGVPVAIKDNIDVAGEATTFGTSAHGPAVTADGRVVQLLRDAGAVIIGKTAVPELMAHPFTESLTFGATRNPWDLGRSPGGSSGGSGAAVAAGLAPLALGSDGGGSIRIPSAWCGLYGLKPQRDRVPLDPYEDSWQGLNVNGPMTRTVADAALFLDITAASGAAPAEFSTAARRDPGRLRIALSTKVPPPLAARPGAAQRDALAAAGALLTELGHQVVRADPDYPPAVAISDYLPRYLRGIHDDAGLLAHPDQLERRSRTLSRLGGLFSDRRIRALRDREPAVAARIQAIFDDVDVVITPGTAAGPPRIGAYQRRGAVSTLLLAARRVPYQPVWNLTGQPAAVLPWSLDRDGLPLSIQLVGRPYDEATLLALSAQIEAARPWAQRRPAGA